MKSSTSDLVIIGSGVWADKIDDLITNNEENIKIYRIGAREFLKNKENLLQKYFIDKNFWISTTPINQLYVLEKLINFQSRIILEKPVVTNINQVNTLTRITNNSKNNIFLCEPWKYSSIWFEIKKSLKTSPSPNKVRIQRGGPIKRSYLNPVWDWLQHDLSLISDLLKDDRENLKLKCFPNKFNESLKLIIVVEGKFEFELNIGFFESRIEMWMINNEKIHDFSKINLECENPLLNMFRNFMQTDLSNDITNSIWLTEKVIKLIDTV
jgi:hypothetical protein